MANNRASKSTSSLRFTSLDPATLSSFQSSGRITRGIRFSPQLGLHPNFSFTSFQKNFVYPWHYRKYCSFKTNSFRKFKPTNKRRCCHDTLYRICYSKWRQRHSLRTLRPAQRNEKVGWSRKFVSWWFFHTTLLSSEPVFESSKASIAYMEDVVKQIRAADVLV